MTREQELMQAVTDLLAAMKKAVDIGCVDHLDCADDGGAFWYDAMEQEKEVL